jgi:hypothetical protein
VRRCGDEALVNCDAKTRRVTEDEGAVRDVQVERDSDRRVEVLQLTGQVIGYRRRRVQQRDRCGADRADRQIVGVCEGGHPEKVGDSPGGGRLDNVDGTRG